MGKAVITTDLGGGQYTVTYLRDRTRIIEKTDALTTRNAEIDEMVAALVQPIDDAETAMHAAEDAWQAAIAALWSPPEREQLEAMFAAQRALIAKQRVYHGLISQRDLLLLEKAANVLLLKKLADQLGNTDQAIWCADYSEGLTGEVGVIEAGRQDMVKRVIYPDDNGGTPGSAAYSAARDGMAQPVLGGTPASVFFNYAMYPGAEKWRPRYRFGRIDTINAGLNTCIVQLDDLQHTASQPHDNLDLNQSILINATFRYMTCNQLAFEVNDRVVVEFMDGDWEKAYVIGFESEPRLCADYRYVAVFKNGATTVATMNNFRTLVAYSLTPFGAMMNLSYKNGFDSCAIMAGDIFFGQQTWDVGEGVESSGYVFETEVTPKGTYQGAGDVSYDQNVFKLFKNAQLLCDFVAQTQRCEVSSGQPVLIASNGSHIFALTSHDEIRWLVYWTYGGAWYRNYDDIPDPHDDFWVTGVTIGATKRVSALSKITHDGTVAASVPIFEWESAGTGGTIIDWDLTPYTGRMYQIGAIAANGDKVFVAGVHSPNIETDGPADLRFVLDEYDTALNFIGTLITDTAVSVGARMTVACGTGFLVHFRPGDNFITLYETAGTTSAVTTEAIDWGADQAPAAAVGGIAETYYFASCAHDHIVLFKVNLYYDGDWDVIYEVQAYQWKVMNFGTWAVNSHGLVKRYTVRQDAYGSLWWPFIAGR